MTEIFELKSSAHIRTAYNEFYKEMKDKNIISQMHELFTFAFLVGLKDGEKNQDNKTGDIFQIQNIDKNNLKIIKGIALMKLEVNDGDELLKEMMEYADRGIEILMTDYQNDGVIRLDKYLV